MRHVGGEPRALQLYCEPGARDDVLAAWTERLGDRAWVRTRDEAVAAGWFGPVAARHLRAGSATSSSRCAAASPSSTRAAPRAELLALVGLHGSLTDDEVAVPVVHVPPARGA